MSLSEREVAEAFSRRDFEDAIPYISERVVWRMPGTEEWEGQAAVVEACRSTTAALHNTRIDLAEWTVVGGGTTVAVDSLIRYHDGDKTSAVAACDIYEFVDGSIVRITSYSVEV